MPVFGYVKSCNCPFAMPALSPGPLTLPLTPVTDTWIIQPPPPKSWFIVVAERRTNQQSHLWLHKWKIVFDSDEKHKICRSCNLNSKNKTFVGIFANKGYMPGNNTEKLKIQFYRYHEFWWILQETGSFLPYRGPGEVPYTWVSA